eukprot:TRINITY_DN1624_c0_g1_i1.p1 TRINITY_DN1624_c0_g1~~TRINITY_DN1624_c0_g1_i1.p1  ORF type:complete len:496 (-),score=67.40 TRINITY_DN1624_c0_g1_i1:279-1766(-)
MIQFIENQMAKDKKEMANAVRIKQVDMQAKRMQFFNKLKDSQERIKDTTLLQVSEACGLQFPQEMHLLEKVNNFIYQKLWIDEWRLYEKDATNFYWINSKNAKDQRSEYPYREELISKINEWRMELQNNMNYYKGQDIKKPLSTLEEIFEGTKTKKAKDLFKDLQAQAVEFTRMFGTEKLEGKEKPKESEGKKHKKKGSMSSEVQKFNLTELAERIKYINIKDLKQQEWISLLFYCRFNLSYMAPHYEQMQIFELNEEKFSKLTSTKKKRIQYLANLRKMMQKKDGDDQSSFEDSDLSVDTQHSVKELKQNSRMQINENVIEEFQGLITIVKDKIQQEFNEQENTKGAYCALTEFEKKYLWTMNEKLKKKRQKQEERRIKKRDGMERLRKTIRGVELMLAQLKKMQFMKSTPEEKGKVTKKWGNAVRVLTLLRRKLTQQEEEGNHQEQKGSNDEEEEEDDDQSQNQSQNQSLKQEQEDVIPEVDSELSVGSWDEE